MVDPGQRGVAIIVGRGKGESPCSIPRTCQPRRPQPLPSNFVWISMTSFGLRTEIERTSNSISSRSRIRELRATRAESSKATTHKDLPLPLPHLPHSLPNPPHQIRSFIHRVDEFQFEPQRSPQFEHSLSAINPAGEGEDQDLVEPERR